MVARRLLRRQATRVAAFEGVRMTREASVLTEAIVNELRAIVGEEGIHIGPAERLAYSYDGTFQQHIPDIAVSPQSTDEVSRVVQVAARERIPVVSRGAGTSLTGGTIPVGGGLVLNLARMNRILEIDTVNTVAVVEAGCVTAKLQAAVEKQGLFYPPDPASLNQSSIGGNAACNAGGPRCLKYGVTKDYIVGMTVVLADGRVVRLGGKLMKNVTGYQLMQLFIGSEGTLGVITELIVRLIPLPTARSTAAAVFGRLEDASRAVTAILAAGILPVTLEMLDHISINAVEDYVAMGLPREAEAMLILETDGSDERVTRAEIDRITAICRREGALRVDAAQTAAERDNLWQARRAISGALGRLRPNKLGEDIVVPRSEIPEMVRRVGRISEEIGLPIAVFGHAGDGNLHPNILFDRRIPGELERVEEAAKRIFHAALELGGTLSGEHGIGTLKREFLEEDLGPVAVEISRRIKDALDPLGILNPHKVFPERGPVSGFLTALPSMEGITPG
jgi:glycolate oxidase